MESNWRQLVVLTGEDTFIWHRAARLRVPILGRTTLFEQFSGLAGAPQLCYLDTDGSAGTFSPGQKLPGQSFPYSYDVYADDIDQGWPY